MARTSSIVVALVVAFLSFASRLAVATSPLTQADANEIAVDAYIYAYPIVLMNLTRRLSVALTCGYVAQREAKAWPEEEALHTKRQTREYRELIGRVDFIVTRHDRHEVVG